MNTENTDSQTEAFEAFELDDKYTVTGVLASGNKGTVYAGVTKLAQRPIAVKILHPEQSEQEAALLRFQAAAEIAGSLNHPNIVNVFGSGVTPDGCPYIVMELLKGENLEDLLKAKGKLDLKSAVNIFLQLAEALSYAHGNNVVHRGLKPNSVILLPESDGKYIVKLVDFDLAKSTFVDHTIASSGSSQKDSLSASPYASYLYASPEYIRGKAADQRSDLYSFACLLFHTIAGRPPYEGKTPVDCMTMHVEDAIPDLAEYVHDEPGMSEVISIVKVCMRKDPVQRLESFRQVVSGLEKAEEQIAAASAAMAQELTAAKAAAEAAEKSEARARTKMNTIFSVLSLVISAGALCAVPFVLDLDLAKVEKALEQKKQEGKANSASGSNEAESINSTLKKIGELDQRVDEAIKANNLAQAENFAREAYLTSLTLPEEDPRIADTLAQLGQVFELRQNYKGALQAYNWSLSYNESKYGPMAPQTAHMKDKVRAVQKMIAN